MKMNIEEFVSNFADQFDETDAAVFTPETKFRDIDEWSSLTALSIIAMVDEEYDVTLRGDDIRNSNTVREIFNIVQARI